jgi:hypothetical protein
MGDTIGRQLSRVHRTCCRRSRKLQPLTSADLVYKRLVYEIANERTVMARLRRRELCHQDRDEPLFWVYPKGCPECPDPIEFLDGARIRIMPGGDSDRKAKTETLAVLEQGMIVQSYVMCGVKLYRACSGARDWFGQLTELAPPRFRPAEWP